MNIAKIKQLALELTDEEINLLIETKKKQKVMLSEEVIDTDTKKKQIVSETRTHMDSVEELISNINPKLKRSLDIAKQQPPTRNAPRR